MVLKLCLYHYLIFKNSHKGGTPLQFTETELSQGRETRGPTSRQKPTTKASKMPRGACDPPRSV